MRRVVPISALLLVTSIFLSATYAQNQLVPGSGSDLSADYPMNRAGVFIQSAEWTTVSNQTPAKTKIAHGIAASLSYGVVPAKIVAEYEGERAPTQVEGTQPILCICHIVSLPGEPVLVRLHPKKGARELDGGRMIVYPIVGGFKTGDANKSDLIPADVSHPASEVWLVRPQSPLESGDYALMLGTQNFNIYPFTVAVPSVQPTAAK